MEKATEMELNPLQTDVSQMLPPQKPPGWIYQWIQQQRLHDLDVPKHNQKENRLLFHQTRLKQPFITPAALIHLR